MQALRSLRGAIIPVDGALVQLAHDLHADSYQACGCIGRPAPLFTWWGVFIFGSYLPCDSTASSFDELYWILDMGRCGCGW